MNKETHSIRVFVSNFGTYAIPGHLIESTEWETKTEWSEEGQCFVERTDPAPINKAPQNKDFFDWLKIQDGTGVY